MKLFRLLLCAAVVLCTFQSCATKNDKSVMEAPTKVLVFDMNEAGSKYYRIPALTVAADGSLVALADKRGEKLGDLPNIISVVAKRSTDGGETWSDMVTVAQGDSAKGITYGDPAVVLDRKTGNLVAVFSGDKGFWGSTKEARANFYVSKSADNGLTWSAPVCISDQIYQPEWYGGFAASGRMLQTESGRIIFIANIRFNPSNWELKEVYEMVCASDDGGDTWTVLNPDARIPNDGHGNETKIIERSNGELMMSIRSSSNISGKTTGHRRYSLSTDGGKTWSEHAEFADMPDPSCNGDIIVYPSKDGKKRMLHSIPNDTLIRQNVSVFLSYDEGKTWPVSKLLLEGYSAYSSLAVLPDGSIGCLVEEGKWDGNLPGEDGFQLYFMKFSLDWLTAEEDKTKH